MLSLLSSLCCVGVGSEVVVIVGGGVGGVVVLLVGAIGVVGGVVVGVVVGVRVCYCLVLVVLLLL